MAIKTEGGQTYLYRSEDCSVMIPATASPVYTIPVNGSITAVPANNEYFAPNCIAVPIWQLCPKCNGDGDLFRHNSPPLLSTNARPICDVCNGKKIISIITGLPPQ